MPTRAPSYYHWAQDKPCTTNQNYGFAIKPDMLKRQAEDRLKPKKPDGPFDYMRPFSNLGFFPEITLQKCLTSKRSRTAPLSKSKIRASSSGSPSSINTFDVNRGFSMGHVPITSRLCKPALPTDVRLIHHKSVPSTYDFPVPKNESIYLWHTLSGCLVHVKNHVPEHKHDAYKRTKAEVRSLSAC